MAEENSLPPIGILFLGDDKVGKTSILHRFTANIFRDNIDKATESKFPNSTTTKIDGSTVSVYGWEMPGLKSVHRPGFFVNDTQGIILVYDVTKRLTFKGLEYWIRISNEIFDNTMWPARIIVGNKTDLPNRVVSKMEGIEFAEMHQTMYAECSSKLAQGVTGVFEKLFRKIVQHHRIRNSELLLSGNQTPVDRPVNGLDNPGITDSRVDDQPQEDTVTLCNII